MFPAEREKGRGAESETPQAFNGARNGEQVFPGLPWIWISMDIHPVDISMDIMLLHL